MIESGTFTLDDIRPHEIRVDQLDEALDLLRLGTVFKAMVRPGLDRDVDHRSGGSVKVVGYSDRLSVRAGESIDFKVSCDSPEYSVQIVRLIHGDENPRGPGLKSEDVEVPANGSHVGRIQPIHGGSFVEFDRDGPLRDLRSFTLSAWICPTVVDRGVQAILGAWCATGPGYGLSIGPAGTVELRLANGDGRRQEVSCEKPLVASAWQFVAASVDIAAGTATVVQRHAEWFRRARSHPYGAIRWLERLGRQHGRRS